MWLWWTNQAQVLEVGRYFLKRPTDSDLGAAWLHEAASWCQSFNWNSGEVWEIGSLLSLSN